MIWSGVRARSPEKARLWNGPVAEYIPSCPVVSLQALLDSRPLPIPPPGLFSYARHALLYYLRYLAEVRKKPVEGVLLPDYMCHEVANALRQHGYRAVYYPLADRFEVTVEAIKRACAYSDDADVILACHFYGRMNPAFAECSKLCREKGISIVEDCTHLPFPFLADYQDDDWDARLYSLRKVYPVPYGATIVLREGQERFARYVQTSAPRRFRQGVGEALHWAVKQVAKKGIMLTRRGYTVPYRDMPDDSLKPYDSAFPGLGSLLSKRNFEEAVSRRRANYQTYLRWREVFEMYGHILPFDLDRDVPYMFVLFLSEDRDPVALSKTLMDRSIPAVPGLTLDPCVWEGLPSDHMYRRILTLPVHQDIREGHINYIAEVLARM